MACCIQPITAASGPPGWSRLARSPSPERQLLLRRRNRPGELPLPDSSCNFPALEALHYSVIAAARAASIAGRQSGSDRVRSRHLALDLAFSFELADVGPAAIEVPRQCGRTAGLGRPGPQSTGSAMDGRAVVTVSAIVFVSGYPDSVKAASTADPNAHFRFRRHSNRQWLMCQVHPMEWSFPRHPLPARAIGKQQRSVWRGAAVENSGRAGKTH
jgi:hypothetical protein